MLTKALLVLHAVAAVVLLGSATHNGVLAVALLRGGPLRVRLQRRYAQVMFASFWLTFGLGLLLYPPFKLDVRPQLDTQLPLVTGMFEVKEHWLGVVALVLAAYVPMTDALCQAGARASSWSERRLYATLGICVVVTIWVSACTGWFVSAVEPVGGRLCLP